MLMLLQMGTTIAAFYKTTEARGKIRFLGASDGNRANGPLCTNYSCCMDEK